MLIRFLLCISEHCSATIKTSNSMMGRCVLIWTVWMLVQRHLRGFWITSILHKFFLSQKISRTCFKQLICCCLRIWRTHAANFSRDASLLTTALESESSLLACRALGFTLGWLSILMNISGEWHIETRLHIYELTYACTCTLMPWPMWCTSSLCWPHYIPSVSFCLHPLDALLAAVDDFQNPKKQQAKKK